MENANKERFSHFLGIIFLSLAVRSSLFIEDLLTGIVFLILGISVLYNYESEKRKNK